MPQPKSIFLISALASIATSLTAFAATPQAPAPASPSAKATRGGAASAATPNSAPTTDAAPLKFNSACEPGDTLLISAVGDFLFHSNLQEQADRSPDRYISIWKGILPLFQTADLRYGNLEGPVAPGLRAGGVAVKDPGLRFDDIVYTSYPEFNYPAAVAEDIAASGITIVSTANNHALDRSAGGVDETIQNLTKVGVKYVGTRSSSVAPRWYEITESKGFRIAWIACTFSTNGLIDRDKQVLGCNADTQTILQLITSLKKGYDAVIVTPHWGQEYHPKPIPNQVELGRKFMDAGALAVIGTHPHVLEPWLKYVTPDGVEHFLIYSTGNFASGQIGVQQTSSVLIYLSLGRNRARNTFIRGVGYVPLRMESQSGKGSWVRPLLDDRDQAPGASWTTWYGDFGRDNRIYGTDLTSANTLENKFCQLTK